VLLAAPTVRRVDANLAHLLRTALLGDVIQDAYSGAWRSPFRGDGDRDSELMPITIPS
jgi:hypothetical protein